MSDRQAVISARGSDQLCRSFGLGEHRPEGAAGFEGAGVLEPLELEHHRNAAGRGIEVDLDHRRTAYPGRDSGRGRDDLREIGERATHLGDPATSSSPRGWWSTARR